MACLLNSPLINPSCRPNPNYFGLTDLTSTHITYWLYNTLWYVVGEHVSLQKPRISLAIPCNANKIG